MYWYTYVMMYAWGLLKLWAQTIFVIPIKNHDMLWLLVPIWVSWFFSEFFQEKISTSIGNAISNAVVIIWGCIDCSRQTVNLITSKVLTSLFGIVMRFVLILGIFFYGFTILRLGIKGNKLIKKIGRVRIVTYIFAIFVPVFYNVVKFDFRYFLAAVLFFPLFYYTIELICRATPHPKAITEESDQKRTSQTTAYQPYTASKTPQEPLSKPHLQAPQPHPMHHQNYPAYHQSPHQQQPYTKKN